MAALGEHARSTISVLVVGSCFLKMPHRFHSGSVLIRAMLSAILHAAHARASRMLVSARSSELAFFAAVWFPQQKGACICHYMFRQSTTIGAALVPKHVRPSRTLRTCTGADHNFNYLPARTWQRSEGISLNLQKSRKIRDC